jgi:hypothetical protein
MDREAEHTTNWSLQLFLQNQQVQTDPGNDMESAPKDHSTDLQAATRKADLPRLLTVG